MKIPIWAAQNKQRGRQFDMPALRHQKEGHETTLDEINFRKEVFYWRTEYESLFKEELSRQLKI